MMNKAFVPATWPDQFKGFHVREEKVYIKNDSLIIEGLLYKGSGKKGVVICHPHSLMGGSMYNNVVEALQEEFAAENYFTLRFNFRGVGASSGTYEEGRGEKKDILAVCEYLKETGSYGNIICRLFFWRLGRINDYRRKGQSFFLQYFYFTAYKLL